jgi:hypothetical protein
MKRYISGLNQAGIGDEQSNGLLEGLFLVRVVRVYYRWHAQKPYFVLHFRVLEPKSSAGGSIQGRLYCTAKALWKLTWFLRDFGYDAELLERNEISDQQLIGLTGVLRITHSVVNGNTVVNLEGFAPASQWQESSSVLENVIHPQTKVGA